MAEKFFAFHTVTSAERGSLGMLLPLWFYVKSILRDSKTAILALFEALNIDSFENSTFLKVLRFLNFELRNKSKWQFMRPKNHQIWFHVKSELLFNLQISTLYSTVYYSFLWLTWNLTEEYLDDHKSSSLSNFSSRTLDWVFALNHWKLFSAQNWSSRNFFDQHLQLHRTAGFKSNLKQKNQVLQMLDQ